MSQPLGCRGRGLMTIAVRQAAWRNNTTDGWSEDVIWYAAAIHQMRLRTPDLDEFFAVLGEALEHPSLPERSIARMRAIASGWSDHLGLGYQTQVHGTFARVSRWPAVGGERAMWQECAHNHWFFLPWHRAYLVEFEAVARMHIGELGGPADTWGLPYWNYSDFQQ